MNEIFKELKDSLSDFKSSVSKELEEIRKYKDEIKSLRSEMMDLVSQGKYIRDDDRLILSAPEIIIGNVDSEGDIIPHGESIIVIRGGKISQEGVGTGGSIELRAQSIRQIAVDPGTDGKENVLGSISEIVSQARSISLQANDDIDVFATPLRSAGDGGVLIQADNNILLESSPGADSKKNYVEGIISTLEKQKTSVDNEVSSNKKNFEELLDKIEKLTDKYSGQFPSEDDARANIKEIFELNDEIKESSPLLSSAILEYTSSISRLAEITREIKSLKQQKEKIKTGDTFKNKSNGSSIDIKSERINIVSTDSEQNLKDNVGAGVLINANAIDLASREKDGSLKEKGSVSVSAMNINLQSLDNKNVKVDDSGKITSGEFQVKGKISVRSKEIGIESVDYEVSESKYKEKSLSKDGGLTVRAEKLKFETTDPEGKAVGDISFNSKSIELKSMDVDKEKHTDKSLTQGGSMLLLSEKMFMGSKDKDIESKLIQTSAETIGTFAKNTFEVQQGEKKGILQMDSGKVEISGDKTGLYGETTVNSKTSFKAEIDAPKAVVDSLQAKSQFKSPNISDGMAAGGGGGGGSLSAKLTKEDAPKEENKK